jgi:hypothetical protein
MTKAEARQARKAGTLVDWKPAPAPKPARRRRGEGDAMWRWARRYDALNGAPESDEDR